jgi:hypothetical protein
MQIETKLTETFLFRAGHFRTDTPNTLYIAFRVLVYNKFCTNARQVPLLEQELLPFRSTEFTPVFSGVGLAPILVF